MGGLVLSRLAQAGQNRYVGAAVVGSLIGVILLLFFLLIRGQRDTVILNVQPIEDSTVIQVYVGGEVAEPGLYALPRGERVADAVNAAGGLLQSADTSSLGLASPLRDADQIIVPGKPATPVAPVQGGSGSPAPTAPPQSTAVAPLVPQAIVTPDQQTEATSTPININAAGVEELDILPGIGPAIAARIVEYRLQHGPFQTLDELAEVSGISDRMVDELRPLLSLGF